MPCHDRTIMAILWLLEAVQEVATDALPAIRPASDGLWEMALHSMPVCWSNPVGHRSRKSAPPEVLKA